MSEELAKRIHDAIEAMPSFSHIADRALVDLKDKELNGSTLDELGFHDPKLAKQILHMTNLTSYGLSGFRAGSYESASFEDGDVLRGIMLAHAIQGILTPELKGYELGEGKLWEHSMNCAISTWMIATKVAYKDLERAFVVGLMHDIGKIILDEFVAAEKDRFVDISIQEELTTCDVERTLFGTDHATVGAELAKKWHFDDEVVEVIRYHHRPELDEKEPDLTVMVHLADCICMNLGLAFHDDGLLGLLAGTP